MSAPDSSSRGARGASIVALGWAGLILVVTLMPMEPSAVPVELLPTTWCVICGVGGTADALLNIVLFVPLGWALALGGRLRKPQALRSWRLTSSPAWIILGLALFSTGIELTQTLLVGRFPTFGDVVFNTLGGAVGVGLVAAGWALLAPGPRMARALSLGTGALAGLVFVATSLLFVPSFPSGAYHGQWTADLEYMEAYEGRVLEASIGTMPLPAWRLDDPDAAVELLRSGAPLAVTAIAGPPPIALAPILSIATESEGEIIVLGADRTDLVLRIRYRANDFLLDRPDVRVRDAFARVSPGDTVELGMAGRGAEPEGAPGYRLWLGHNRSEAASFGPLRHTVGEGWALLMHPEHTPAWLDQVSAVLWVGGLLFLVGWWGSNAGGGWIRAAAGPTIALLGMLVAAWLNPLIALSATELGAIAAGTLLGWLLGRVSARAAPRQRAGATGVSPPQQSRHGQASQEGLAAR